MANPKASIVKSAQPTKITPATPSAPKSKDNQGAERTKQDRRGAEQAPPQMDGAQKTQALELLYLGWEDFGQASNWDGNTLDTLWNGFPDKVPSLENVLAAASAIEGLRVRLDLMLKDAIKDLGGSMDACNKFNKARLDAEREARKAEREASKLLAQAAKKKTATPAAAATPEKEAPKQGKAPSLAERRGLGKKLSQDEVKALLTPTGGKSAKSKPTSAPAVEAVSRVNGKTAKPMKDGGTLRAKALRIIEKSEPGKGPMKSYEAFVRACGVEWPLVATDARTAILKSVWDAA